MKISSHLTCVHFSERIFRLTESEAILFKSKELNNFNSHLLSHRFLSSNIEQPNTQRTNYPSIFSNQFLEVTAQEAQITHFKAMKICLRTSISVKER